MLCFRIMEDEKDRSLLEIGITARGHEVPLGAEI